MGGPVAQLLWRRHPEVVDGLVLCATAAQFSGRREERIGFMGLTGLAAMARISPDQATRWLTDQFFLQRKSKKWEPWAMREASHHDWRMVLEAGRAIGSFSSVEWIGSIDVPVANVITMRDTVVPLGRQTALYELDPRRRGVPGRRRPRRRGRQRRTIRADAAPGDRLGGPARPP